MFSLAQFKSVFKVRDSKGQPYILIGGQAVNFWATRYLSVEPVMAAWLPFTSRDIDFKGTRQDAEHIARQLGLHKNLPPIMVITALAGAIPLTVDGAPSNIEIVRLIPGATEKTLALTESATGARLSRRFAVNWPEILPLKEIRQCQSPRVIQFREKRLPAWEQKLSRK